MAQHWIKWAGLGTVAAGAGVGVALYVHSRNGAKKTATAGTGSGSTASSSSQAASGALPVSIPVQPLGALQVGRTFAHQWTAEGGTGDGFTWGTYAGELPPGLALSTSGLMAGVPTQAGTYTFTVQATDAGNHSLLARRAVTVTVAAAVSNLSIPEQSLGTLRVGAAFSHQWTATGGSTPYSWSVEGSVPPGLTLTQSGYMYGTPTLGGQYHFVVYCADATGNRTGRSTDVTVKAAAASHAASGSSNNTGLGGSGTVPVGTVLYSSGGKSGTPGSVTVTDVSGGTPGTTGSVDLKVTKTSATGKTTSQVVNVETNPSTGTTSINTKLSSLGASSSGSGSGTARVTTSQKTSAQAASLVSQIAQAQSTLSALESQLSSLQKEYASIHNQNVADRAEVASLRSQLGEG